MNSKFILAEDFSAPSIKPKFILTEVVLTESATKKAIKVANKILAAKAKIEAALKSINIFAKKTEDLEKLLTEFNPTVTAIENIQKTLGDNTPQDSLTDLKITLRKTFISQLNKFIEAIGSFAELSFIKLNPKIKTELGTLLNDIRELTGNTWNTDTARIALSDYDKCKKLLETALGIDISKTTKITEKNLTDVCSSMNTGLETLWSLLYTDYDDLATAAKMDPEILQQYSEVVIKLEPQFADLLKWVASKKEGAISQFIDTLDTKLNKELLVSISTLRRTELAGKQQAKIEDNNEKEKRKAAGDWEWLYWNCKTTEDFNAFWDGNPAEQDPTFAKGYFKAVWKENSEVIKKLGMPFQNLLTRSKLGWTAEDNPFIAFLNIYNEQNPQMHNLSQASFSGLIKAYNDSYITKDDLRAKGICGVDDIIFNSNLFKKSAGDLINYLHARNEIIKAMKNTTYTGIPEAARTFFNQENTKNKATVINNILLKAGNQADLTSPVEDFGPLRDLLDIQRILKEFKVNLTLSDGIGKPKDKNNQVANISKALEWITSRSTAKQVLAFLVDQFSIYNAKAVSDINAKLNGYIFSNLGDYSHRDIPKFVENIGTTNFKLNTEKMEEFLVGAAKKAGYIETE